MTLKLNKTVIDSAKKYAKKHNRSLSGMVENYFSTLESPRNYPHEHSSLVKNLSGILSEDELSKFASEDERARYILTKET